MDCSSKQDDQEVDLCEEARHVVLGCHPSPQEVGHQHDVCGVHAVVVRVLPVGSLYATDEVDHLWCPGFAQLAHLPASPDTHEDAQQGLLALPVQLEYVQAVPSAEVDIRDVGDGEARLRRLAGFRAPSPARAELRLLPPVPHDAALDLHLPYNVHEALEPLAIACVHVQEALALAAMPSLPNLEVLQGAQLKLNSSDHLVRPLQRLGRLLRLCDEGPVARGHQRGGAVQLREQLVQVVLREGAGGLRAHDRGGRGQTETGAFGLGKRQPAPSTGHALALRQSLQAVMPMGGRQRPAPAAPRMLNASTA
mmetsp:Transcript_61112/g.189848  ORF Transcript_61112/g.189848 Transcript_61112/m.189848 type:complete len:309 (+) Transcript_61112:792-1718(+)